MNVAYDTNGYPYDVDTGIAVTITYDENGDAYDAATGEGIDSITYDQTGHTIYQGGAGWNQTLQQIAGSVFRPSGGYGPSGQPIRTGVTANQGGIGASVSLPKWAVYGLGAIALGYAFGFIKQGRR